MAHPVREPLVEDLLTRLDRPVEVAWDVGPPSGDKPKLWQVRRAALELASGDWHLVLQDDALPCPDLLTGLEAGLDHVPDDVAVVSPYLGTLRPHTSVFVALVRDADAEGACWIRTASAWWGVALACRTAAIPGLIEAANTMTYLADDTRVNRYFREIIGQDTYYTWPSLVDHREVMSLVGHTSQRHRRAHRWHERSALELRWDGPVTGRGHRSSRRPRAIV